MTSERPHNEFDVYGLIDALKICSKERKTIRRILCRYLRRNKHIINDGWIIRKMNGGWLGDLTDDRLITYCIAVIKSLDE